MADQEGKEEIKEIMVAKVEGDHEEDEDEHQGFPSEKDAEKKPRVRKYLTKHMKMYPELYRSDVSIHPSYTTLKNLPYYVVCRHRVQRAKKQIKRQLSREVMHFAMMQMFAIDSVRIDRVFSVGIPPKTLIVPDFVTANERRHINELLRDTCGASPLELWDMRVRNGYVRRITDEEVKSLALELSGTNVTTTYIFSPPNPKKALGIRLPFLIMIIKNMKKYFTFEITILDDKNMHRRFRMSNFQSTTRVRPFSTSMPIGLSGGWNQIQFNLADFTRRAYGTNYVETTRMQIHANCRIRRIYFADRLYSEDELPEDFKLFLPIHRKKCVREEDVKKPEDIKVTKETETMEAPPFEADEAMEDAEEDEEEEDESEEVAPEELIDRDRIVSKEKPETIREVDEEEEEEDEAELPEMADYMAEEEDDAEERATTRATSPGDMTEEETDVEQAAVEDEDE